MGGKNYFINVDDIYINKTIIRAGSKWEHQLNSQK